MDCSWRRTLASVFLLLSPHSLRVLSQNVVPTGPLPPPPFMREPINDIGGFGLGLYQQPMNLIQPPPGLTEFVAPGPCIPLQGADQFRLGPPGLLNPATANVGPFSQIPICNIEPILVESPLQDQFCNVPNFNIPSQQGNVPQCPFNLPPPVITLPVPVLSTPQIQNCNALPITNLPPPPGPPLNLPAVPLTPGPPCSIYSEPQVLAGPINLGQTFVQTNLGALQNPQLYPTPFPQQCPAPVMNSQLPCPALVDKTTVTLSSTPNLPSMIPLQNYGPIPPSSYQAVPPPPLIPMEYIPIAPIAAVNVPSPNFQIAALPPVLPVLDIPQYYDYTFGTSRPIVEECNPVPINLEINVPSPNMPDPKITVITAFTSPPPTSSPVVTTDSSDISFGLLSPPPLLPLPPIIIEGRRSRSRSWWPLILIALFARDGYDGGGGGCCCSCPCCSCSDIPIPFPIPIPTNNPIILDSGRSSRCKESRVKVKTNE